MTKKASCVKQTLYYSKNLFLLFSVILFLSLFFNTGCLNLIKGPDPKDTEFSWESEQVEKSWGKLPLKLETMFGFHLRMSKPEYEKNFDSLILVGLANHKKEIRFGDTFEEYFEVKPYFYRDTLFQIDFKVNFALLVSDTAVRSVDMLDIIQKLYPYNSIKKVDTVYSSDPKKILLWTDVYGWIDNNRLIRVYRIQVPESFIRQSEFEDVEFIDLELRSRQLIDKSNQESLNIDMDRANKLKSISK